MLTALIVVLVVSPALGANVAEAVNAVRAPESYGGWVLLPAIVAILCAIVTRQVVPALLLGVVVAACMLHSLEPAGGNIVFETARRTVEQYIIGACVDEGHAKVMVFTLVIGGMVGVLGASGGTRALVDVIARRASSPRGGQLTAWAAGLVVFFDDYANSMIVGPTMQPICDRLGISRAKLAYIVDSTAAPVASIALVGTWVGAELDFIAEGLNAVKADGGPAFLANVDAWQAFVYSIPYRFYAVLAIVMVFLVAISKRDFGPMRKAEADPQAGNEEREDRATGDSSAADTRGHWSLAAIPILVLVSVTMAVLVWPGLAARKVALERGESFGVAQFFANADSYNAILYGAFASAIVAVLFAVISGRLKLSGAVQAMTDGMARVFPAIVVLVLAWSLSAAGIDLHVGEVVASWLREQGFSFAWLPLGVFVASAFVSFATGTSWGTMGILCPMVVRVSAELGADVSPDIALPLFYASVGSVLSGAIFGDHCSPISDTTVLSSIASGCPLGMHVWTQLPYALVTAVVAMGAGDTLCSKLGFSPWVGLAAGTVVLALILRVVGKRPPAVL